MSNSKTENISNNSSDVTLKDVAFKFKSAFVFLRGKWLLIFITGALFGVLGIVYSLFNKPKYKATCTFVLDEGSRAGGMSQYAGLASLAGIDLGSTSAGGIFQGDNILELYKSRIMIEKALLTEANFNGKNQLLIDRYIEFNKFRDRWKVTKGIGDVQFTGDPEKFNRVQDSIISEFAMVFNSAILNVAKPSKALGIIQVEVTSTDELFAKVFADKLVSTVSNFYIQTKTEKAARTVQILQKQSDSVRAILNSSISGVASAIDAAPNANPSLLSLRVPSQKRQVDVQANTAIYGEVVKNLELSKMTLRQETPLIQVIDKPVLPLLVTRVGKTRGLISGFALGAIFSCLFLLIKKTISEI